MTRWVNRHSAAYGAHQSEGIACMFKSFWLGTPSLAQQAWRIACMHADRPRPGPLMIHCALVAGLFAPSILAAHEAVSSTAPNAPARGDAEGRWVKTQDAQWFIYSADATGESSTAPLLVVGRGFPDMVSGDEESRYSVAVDPGQISVGLNVQRMGAGSAVWRGVRASRMDSVIYQWQPASRPIVDRKVLFNFLGQVVLFATASTSGEDDDDTATAEAFILSSGSGTIAGNQVVPPRIPGQEGSSPRQHQELRVWSRSMASSTRSSGRSLAVGSFPSSTPTTGQWMIVVSFDRILDTQQSPIYAASLSQSLGCRVHADASRWDRTSVAASALSTVQLLSPR